MISNERLTGVFMNINSTDSDTSKLEKIFGSDEGRRMFMAYGRKFTTLPTHERSLALDLIQGLLTKLLDDQFQEARYDTQNNPHLAAIKDSNPDVFENWKKEVELSSAEMMESRNIKVIETDHPKHIFFMGTRVADNSQSIHGDASLNKCLLGYLLDGKHRLCIVSDENGNMLAQSVLRLLMDSQSQPVLFQERVYSAKHNPEFNQLLRKIALKKAESLGIPLVGPQAVCSEEKVPYSHTPLQAKAKPVPFEYVDAKGCIEPGAYSISEAFILN
jgi:hypothetical protein